MDEVKIEDAKEKILSQLDSFVKALIPLAEKDIEIIRKDVENLSLVLKQHYGSN